MHLLDMGVLLIMRQLCQNQPVWGHSQGDIRRYGGYSRKSRCASKVIVWSDPLSKLNRGLMFSRCNTESEWYQIHENIIKKLNARYNLTGSNAGECVPPLFISGLLFYVSV